MQTSLRCSAVLAGILVAVGADAQVVERERPAEWENLVPGGRFMDRFLPMPPVNSLSSDTWGADHVKPRDVDNGLEDSTWSYWGGNARRGQDGRYHLFVCRWLESSPRGHMAWSTSEVVHAAADQVMGPYRVVDRIGPGHNPEVFRLRDGRFAIYMINGCYIASGLNGPWERSAFSFEPRDRRIIEGLSNLTFAEREDGSVLMVCRGGGVWFSQTGLTPYHQVTDGRVYPPVDGRFEDPVVWRTHIQYHLVVNDWLGRIAYYLRSKDGIHWKVDPGEAYLPGIARYEDGTKVDWFKYERMKVFQDEYGRATQAHFAVIDVLKRDDKASDEHSSKHICIPLTVGRLLTILDPGPVTTDTRTLRVKVSAEDGFDPHTDMDLDSLRFGAAEQVNFGGGCTVLEAERSGEDLIVTFAAAGHGLTDANFVAKLLGATRHGDLLYGYARLPWLTYLEPALSARMPRVTPRADRFDLRIEVQNFGQVASVPTPLSVRMPTEGQEREVAIGIVPPLEPFAATTLTLSCTGHFTPGVSVSLKVVLQPEAQEPVTLEGEVTPEEEPRLGAA